MKFSAIKIILLALTCALVLTACSSKKNRYDANGNLITEEDLAGGYDARFADGEIPTAEDGSSIFRDIFFAYDSSSVDEVALQDIEYNLQVMNNYPDLKVQIEGHTDERGTAEYNMALGSKRAKAVSDVLVSLGADNARVTTITYGEELPLEAGLSDSAFSKNRRAHFAAFKQ